MTPNSDNIVTQIAEPPPLKSHQRKTKRVGINKGQLVQLVFNQEQVYRPCQGTVMDDSFHGCGLLVNSDEKVSKGQKVLILIENIEPIKAQVMWVQSIGDTQFRIGVKYLISKTVKTKLFFQKINSPNS